MNIVDYVRSTAEKALASKLAEQLAKDLPSTQVEKGRKLLSVNKVTRLLERTYQLASDYQREHRIGFIKRALLANSFKWELKTKGYPEDFVDMATEGLIVALSKKAPMPDNPSDPCLPS